MADDALNFKITANSGVFESELKRAASTAKAASGEIATALDKAADSADKLNGAKAAGFETAVGSAARAAKAASGDIGSALGSVADSVAAMNRSSTAQFQREVRSAAEVAVTASNRMLDAETRRAAILGKLRAQQGPDRNTDTFQGANTVTPRAFVAAQSRSVQNAFAAQQREINAALAEESERAARAASSTNAYALAEERAGHAIQSTISRQVKEDAALRAIQGDLTGVRAAGAFLTSLPGVGAAVAASFELIGAVALISALAEVVKKVYEAVHALNEMPDAIHQAFGELNRSADLSAAQLDVSNDKLRDQIALIEHKPRNGAAEALDEARERADQLAISLAADKKAMDSLLDQHSVGLLGELLGKGATGAVAQNIRDREGKISADSDAESDAYGRGDTKGAQAAHAQLASDLRAAVASVEADRALRGSTDRKYTKRIGTGVGYVDTPANYAEVNGNQSANLELDEGAARQFRLRLSRLQGQDENTRLSQQLKTDEDGKRTSEEAKRRGQEAARAAAEHERENRELLRERPEDITSRLRKEREKQASDDTEQRLRDSATTGRLEAEASEDVSHSGKRYTRFRREQRDLESQPDSSSGELRAYSIGAAQAAGSISRFDAAVQLQKLHTDQYNASLARLNREQADLKNQGLNEADSQTENLAIENQRAKLIAERAVQQLRDGSAIDDIGLTNTWRKTMDQFVQASRDTAGQIGDIFSSTLGGVNNSLATALTAEYRTGRERSQALRDGLSQTVRGTGARVANAGLEKIEGSALKALGFGGKADGSSANPYYVRMADGAAAAAGGLGGLLGRIFGGGKRGSGDGDSGGGLVSGIESGLGSALQGAFASGGDVVANRPALIGERGPELFVPRSAGTIVPNDQLGGGDTHLHYAPSIDARGATDPAAVSAIVDRQLRQHAPSIIAAANYKARDTAQRRPASAR